MNDNVLNYLLFNGYEDTFKDLYKNSDSQVDFRTLLNKRSEDSLESESRKSSETIERKFRSNSMQGDLGTRRARFGSGTHLSTGRASRPRRGSVRNLDLHLQDQDSKITKMLTFKKGRAA